MDLRVVWKDLLGLYHALKYTDKVTHESRWHAFIAWYADSQVFQPNMFWVQMIGIVLFVFSIRAIWSLGIINAVGLWPMLMFSSGLVFGPWVMHAKEGEAMGNYEIGGYKIGLPLTPIAGAFAGLAMLAGFSFAFGFSIGFGVKVFAVGFIAAFGLHQLYRRIRIGEFGLGFGVPGWRPTYWKESGWSEINKPRRFVSELARGAVLFLGATIWITVVPVTDLVPLSVIGLTGYFPGNTVFLGVLQGISGLFALYVFGHVMLSIQMGRLMRRHAQVWTEFERRRGEMQATPRGRQVVVQIEGLFTKVATSFGSDAPAVVKEKLNLIEGLLGREPYPVGTPSGGGGGLTSRFPRFMRNVLGESDPLAPEHLRDFTNRVEEILHGNGLARATSSQTLRETVFPALISALSAFALWPLSPVVAVIGALVVLDVYFRMIQGSMRNILPPSVSDSDKGVPVPGHLASAA